MDTPLGKIEANNGANLIPFAPGIDEWTEDHFSLYTLIELAVGNRREVSKEEAEEIAIAEEAERIVESGDPDWLEKVKAMMGDSDLDDLDISDEMLHAIEDEENLRGE